MKTVKINNTVSFYNNAEDSRSKIYRNLDYILLDIIGNDEQLKQQAEIVRNQPDEKTFKEDLNSATL